ncbi:MAG: NADH-quinone oxidoreductase subunit A [Phycisphaerae bacterium]|nr:NADH-quinone oxidoreductase subunit A [Phycisphaerae bacterium]
MLATADYALIALMALLAIATVVGILVSSYLIGPRRAGEIKHGTYESGVAPFTDSRRRFNVRFYLVAVLFLVFDVEIVFLYPWATLFRHVRGGAHDDSEAAKVAATILDSGYDPTFMVVTIGFFFALLVIGLVYEWRKGVFRWD